MPNQSSHNSNLIPYIYLQCPCSDISQTHQAKEDDNLSTDRNSDAEEEQTFDPGAARSNYSLYPLEHLLYCEDCRQIRCPRCVLDEIVTWYCPNCLFEVPSSAVKSEGNRCIRSCFQCPICVATLSVVSLEPQPEGLEGENVVPRGPFILNCSHCMWTTNDIGIRFEKQNGLYAQLSKIKENDISNLAVLKQRKDTQHQQRSSTSKDIDAARDMLHSLDLSDRDESLDRETQFSNLKAFYKSQLAEIAPVGPLGYTGDLDYGSPGTLSRIMGLYTGTPFVNETKSKLNVMHEACTPRDGLQVFHYKESAIITQLRSEGWHNTSTYAQRKDPTNMGKRFVSDLRPLAYPLRTKRSKRCRNCRQILSRPDGKVLTTRFRIRMIASNYIPSISINPLLSSSSSSSTMLRPLKPVQYLLTCKNPLFERIKVTLATPAETPGNQFSKTTILCPQFEVNANTDVWDEALQDGNGHKNSISEKRRMRADLNGGQQQAEAGKVWETGRNWVSVVLEVVPTGYNLDKKISVGEQKLSKESEEICEIPVFVRVEWETDSTNESNSPNGMVKTAGGLKEARELAYWCVLGVGRIGNK